MASIDLNLRVNHAADFVFFLYETTAGRHNSAFFAERHYFVIRTIGHKANRIKVSVAPRDA